MPPFRMNIITCPVFGGHLTETVYGHGHIPLYKDFYEAIANDRDPYIPGEEGRKAVDIVLGIYKSWHEKAPVKMPFEFSTKALG